VKNQGALPQPAAEALKKAAQVQPTKSDPLARVKALERATDMARRLYPDMFKQETPNEN
jgi:hypothetical protein